MAEFPALPLWTDALLGDTTHLSAEEFGVYMLLLIAAWRRPDCDLPDDDALLARYARVTPRRWDRLKAIIRPFFRSEDGMLHQKRLRAEKKFVNAVREKRRAAANAKHLKSQNTSDAHAGAHALHPHPHPHPHLKEDSTLSANADISSPQQEPEPEPVAPDGAAAPAKAVAVRDRSPPAGEFERWWAEVPRRVGKDAARRKFTAVVKAGQVTVDELVAGIRRYAQHIRTNSIEPQYVAHPATWLHQGRWQDELTDHRHGRRAEPYVSPAAEIITEHLQRLAGLPDERDFAPEGGYSGEPGGKIVALPRRA